MRIAFLSPGTQSHFALLQARELAIGLSRRADVDSVVLAAPGLLEVGVDTVKALGEAGICCRDLRYRIVTRDDAEAVVELAGDKFKVCEDSYCIAMDGASDFLDCDLWVQLSPVTPAPLLPLRPLGILLPDCAVRYVPETIVTAARQHFDHVALRNLRNARAVFVPCPSIGDDARSFYGLRRNKIRVLSSTLRPSADALSPSDCRRPRASQRPYFVWDANGMPVGNCNRVVAILRQYWRSNGPLDCVVLRQVPVDSEWDLLTEVRESTNGILDLVGEQNLLRRIRLFEVHREAAVLDLIRGAEFLLHANLAGAPPMNVMRALAVGTPVDCTRYAAAVWAVGGAPVRWLDPYDKSCLREAIESHTPSKAVGPRPPHPTPELPERHWPELESDLDELLNSLLQGAVHA